MGEKKYIDCTLQNQTGGGLALTSASLGSGKWVSGPVSNVTNGQETEIFKASGRKGAAVGTDGKVKYQAQDGTVFTINFDVPQVKANQLDVTCDGPLCANYSYPLPTYSQSGSLDVTITITNVNAGAVK